MEKTVWQFLKILKQLCDLAILLLGIYPRQMKIYIHTKTLMQMFRAGLFIKKKKGPKCLSTERWIYKMYIHPVEYYLAINRNKY